MDKQCGVCDKTFEVGKMHVAPLAGGRNFYFCLQCREDVFRAVENGRCWNCGNETRPDLRRLIVLREKLEMVCFSCHKRMYLEEYDKSRETVNQQEGRY